MPNPSNMNMTKAMPSPAHKQLPFELIPLFENRSFSGDAPVESSIDYYIYDPVAHGAPADQSYPMIVFFHGSQMNLFENAAILGTDMGIFASKEYQDLLGGNCYIVLPRANEKRLPDGQVSGFWGFWDGKNRVTERSAYLPVLGELVRSLIKTEHIDPARIAVGGCSAGGLMCWQFAITYPELCAAAFPVAPIYTPTDKELDMLEEDGVKLWIVHGKKDELAVFDKLTGAILPQLLAHKNVRVSALDEIRYGNGKIVHMDMGMETGQHQAQFAIGQNMLYNDGTPYDEAYPEGFIPWLLQAFEERAVSKK